MARIAKRFGRFVGRVSQLAELRELLADVPLVTLVGPGGVGKTRLALEVVADLPVFDTVVVVELASYSDGSLIAPAFAQAAGVRGDTGASLLLALCQAIGDRAMLLVADNCEHVLDHAAEVIQTVLAACPSVAVLATSRAPLDLAGEVAWQVPPLALPPLDSPADGLTADAATLFVDRARSASRSFRVSTDDARAIARICARLDGIPLAIELAAAGTHALSATQIADMLDQSPAILDLTRRGNVPRHRSLRDTLDWSYRLLDPGEQALLRRLSVFAGPFDADAASAVCDLGASTEARLASLVDRSLLEPLHDGSKHRFRLLEMVRQLAAEKLADAGEGDDVDRRHANSVRSRLRAFDLDERGPSAGIDARELSAIRVALRFAINDRDVALADDLILSAWWSWLRLAHVAEARSWVEEVSALTQREGARIGRGLGRALGIFRWLDGDLEGARRAFAEALEQDPADAVVRSFASQVELSIGDLPAALELAERGADADQPRWCLAAALTNLGNVHRGHGTLEAARDAHQESLAICVGLGEPWGEAMARRNLGLVALAANDVAGAHRYLAESLAICRRLGERWFLSRGLDAVAEVISRLGSFDVAARILGAAAALRESMGLSLLEMYRDAHERNSNDVRNALGDSAFAEAYAEGRALTPDEAVDLVFHVRHGATQLSASPVRLAVRALGRTTVERDGRALASADWTYGKPLDLLMLLLCHGDRTREEIGVALWPESPPDQVRNSLGVALHRLRRALGSKAWVLFEGGRYRFNRDLPYRFDVEDFESLIRVARASDAASRLASLLAAVDVYGGELLGDRPDAPWIGPRREALHFAFVTALVEAGDSYLDSHQPRAALDRYQEAIRSDSYVEAAHRGAARALGAMGERAAAIRQLERLRDLLGSELGVEPADATLRLEAELRTGPAF